MVLIVISENIFSKFIEFDNSKIELIIKRLFLIYGKCIKRKKLKYFFKFRNNSILSTFSKKNAAKRKRKIFSNLEKVYERLFNYSIIREKMLYNLSNKYLLDEEDKYPFFPKINSNDSNFYIKNQQLYEIPHIKEQYYTERNFFKEKRENKLINLKNNFGNYTNHYIKKKHIPNAKYRNNLKYKTYNSSPFSKNNINFSNVNERTVNTRNIKKNASTSKAQKIITNPSKYKHNKNNNFLYFIDEDEENGENHDFSKNNKNLNLNTMKNKSFSCGHFSSNLITKRNKNYINNINRINKISIPKNNFKISRNNDLNYYLNNRNKKDKYENSKEIVIPKRNGQNIEHEKKLVNSCNSSTSLYNVSSIGGSLLKESIKYKSRQSPNKKEHLFSFGSDLFYVDNNNSNYGRIKSNNKKKGLMNRNNILKTGSSMISQKYQVSTKSSGTNTNSYYNNYNFNVNKEKNKNGLEKYNHLKIQGLNEYSITNNLNILDKDLLNLQTTLQTLTDSKILDLANNYISEDDSLEQYNRNNGIYKNKNII